ncbi:hypothetical protein D3C85_1517320 [compost metagenome]
MGSVKPPDSKLLVIVISRSLSGRVAEASFSAMIASRMRFWAKVVMGRIRNSVLSVCLYSLPNALIDWLY